MHNIFFIASRVALIPFSSRLKIITSGNPVPEVLKQLAVSGSKTAAVYFVMLSAAGGLPWKSAEHNRF